MTIASRLIAVGLTTLALLVASILPIPGRDGVPNAAAQDVLRIAAVVNEEVISIYDLAARLEIVIATSNLNDNNQLRRQIAPQVLRSMIDESLQMQEATRLDVEVGDDAIAAAIERLEGRTGGGPGSFDKFVRGKNLSRISVINQMRAEIAWATVVGRRLGSSVTVGEDEIDEAISRLENSRGQPEFRISEIFLAVETPDREAEVVKVAENLVTQLRQGADFRGIARQFSQSATAAVGGDVGWILESQLPPELAEVTQRLAPGDVSDPIRTFEGFFIVEVNAKRRVLTADPMQTKLHLSQVVFEGGVSDTTVQLELLARLRREASNCKGLLDIVKGQASELSGDLGTVLIRDLPRDVQLAVMDVPVGQLSDPMPYESGIRVLMVCERVTPQVQPPDRQQMRQTIANRRLELLARRYLRDLRRHAFVDVRI